ncbi:MAG: MOSC domain-containing protein [Cyclobacteriaceae bacterium]|nr:MOSC domain-containing protein [Cyclobacteriaceae bacterium]
MNKRILTEIWIYPVKSLGGIRLKSSQVMGKGLRYDRRWMLVDENNMFMTQRICHSMALFKLSFVENGFKIQFKTDSHILPLHHQVIDTPLDVQVWDDRMKAFEVSEESSRWFSERLGLNCKLVFFPEENQRLIDEKFRVNNEQVSLADAYPLLVVGQSSLNDLNERLEDPVPMNRFRPNLVFTGGEAFEEDQWKDFTVGSNRFVGIKPCARCILTTINQDTAEKGREPLLTLSNYRKRDSKIYFGLNSVPVDQNEIKEGDEIIFK